MSTLMTIQMPQNTVITELPTPHGNFVADYQMQYLEVGRAVNNKKIINCIVNDAFVWPGRLDGEGSPMTPTSMPPGWVLLAVHEIQRGSDLIDATPGTPVVHDAGTITDTTITLSQRYTRRYVRPVIVGEVVTGVILLDRTGSPIVQDDTGPEPVYVISGATPASDGSYTKTWTIPAKNVPGVGKVVPEALEPDGTYVETPYTTFVKEPALVEHLAMNTTEYIEHMPDIRDANGQNPTRPTVADEIVLFGGYRRAM